MSFQTKKLWFKPGEFLPCIRAVEQKDEVRNVISRDGLCVGKLLGGKLCTEKENAVNIFARAQ